MRLCGHFPLVFLAVAGCAGSSEGSNAAPIAEDAGTAVDGGATAVDSGATTVDAAAATLAAPRLDSLMKMSGALHVNWTNLESACTTVRVERKDDQGHDWAEKFSVPGTANNKMDGTATANAIYTYRVRCEKSGAFSAYSNELAKNPTL